MSAQHPGEKSLPALLAGLTPSLHTETYVFATVGDDSALPPASETLMFFREAEGVTVIVSLDYAKKTAMEYFFPCKKITLQVTSSLEAVGFLAVVTTRLAAMGMGVNPVSGFHHDHLFVPLGREEEAMRTLRDIAEAARE